MLTKPVHLGSFFCCGVRIENYNHRTDFTKFLMEQSWENWSLDLEMDDDKDLLEECHTDEEEFLRDILSQPCFSSESESQSFVHNSLLTVTTFGGGTTDGSSDEVVMEGSKSNGPGKRARPNSSPRTYILSFDNSTIIPSTPETLNDSQQVGNGRGGGTRCSKSNSTLSSKKRSVENLKLEQPKAKRGRSASQTLDHIMAERKRRQELTERFIALSATIPALKKTDKSSILREAIDYVKQLQERVKELEQRNKRDQESMIILKNTDFCANQDTIPSETTCEDCCSGRAMLPDVEARVMENEVLIEIHCEKEYGVELKILDLLENLHLCVTASSLLPFGNSTLGITIIAQMGDAYRITVNDVVKNLRQVLLNHMNINADPF